MPNALRSSLGTSWTDEALPGAADEGEARSDPARVVAVDSGITAAAFQALVDSSPAGTVLALEAGRFRFDRTIVVGRDDITIQGAGADRTTIALPPGLGQEAFRIGDGRSSGSYQLAGPVAQDGTRLTLTGTAGLQPGDYLYLARASTEAFYDEIGDTAWRNTDVPLRTSIVRVAAVDGNAVTLESGVHFPFVPGETTVREIALAENVTVGGFTVDFGLGEADPSDFSNRLGAYDRNAVIEVNGTAGLVLSDIAANDVPSLGVNVALSRDARLDGITMTGAHNKGDGGNGYALQIRDVYDSSFANLSDRDMRHSVVFASWRSSAGNEVHVLSTDRDINFHGARHQNNTVWVDQSLRDADSDIIGPTLFYNLTGTHYGAPVDPATNPARFGQVLGSRLPDDIRGYDGGAWLDGAGGHDTVTGGSGNDSLRGGTGNDRLVGGAGTDLADYDGQRSSFTVTRGAAGEATVRDGRHGQGTDSLAGVEWLVFDDGALRLSDLSFQPLSAVAGLLADPATHDPGGGGGPLPPTVISDFGVAATLRGTTGADVFVVGNRSTVVQASGGADTARAAVDFAMSADLERLELVGGGAVDGTGSAAADTILGSGGSNTLRGADGDDWLSGRASADLLDGGAGQDRLSGGFENDTLQGGAGDDRLAGGRGRDVLTGGEGRDVFLFGGTAGSRPGAADLIMDMGAGDVIDLQGVDANSLRSGDQAFVWNGSGAGRLVLLDGTLRGDVDGDGRWDFELGLGQARPDPDAILL